MRTKTTAVLVTALTALAACASPEAKRLRAGGPGADVGNVGADVRIHEGAEPYYKTPRLIGRYSGPAGPGGRETRGDQR
jgi:hypothetical protein